MTKLRLQVEPISSEGIRIPFGRHKDQKLEVIPDSYLKWCLENFDWDRYEDLLSAIEDVLERREWEIKSEEEEEWEERY